MQRRPRWGRRKKKKTARERTQKPFKETSRVRTQGPLKKIAKAVTSVPQTNSQGEHPRTFEEPDLRWRVQKKRKEEEWKKKRKKKKKKQVKYRRRRWWKKRKENMVSLLRLGGKKKRKKRKAKRKTDVPERDKTWGSLEDGSFSLCCRDRIGCVSMLQRKDCRERRR